MTLGQRIKSKRKEKKLTQKELAGRLGIDHTTISKWESDTYEPDATTLNELADIFDVKVGWLTGHNSDSSSPYYALTEKDERDIAKDLERIMNNLDSDHALAFYGEEAEYDEEAKEMLRIQLEQTMRMAKQMAKKKFTPKKYRK